VNKEELIKAMLSAASKNLSFNSVAGTLARSHPDSEFNIMHRNSKTANELFSVNTKSVVLQVMLCGDDRIMVEYLPNGYWEPSND